MTAAITCEVLLAPAYCAPSKIEAFVESLLQIKLDLEFSALPPKVEDDIESRLIESGDYPCDKLFNSNISSLDDCIYSGRDVARLVGNIISMASSVNDLLPEHVCEWSSLNIDQVIGFSPERGRQFNDLLSLIAISKACTNKRTAVIHPNDEFSSWSARISGTVDSMYPELLDGLPRVIVEDISVYPVYSDYMSSLNPDEIFESARNDYGVKLAIYVGAMQLLERSGRSRADIQWGSFSLGAQFVQSLIDHQCYFGQRFHSVCFECICHVVSLIEKNEVNPFYTSDKSDVQRSKGGLLAWRTHITKRHEALRLMFWKGQDGHIELANVGNKYELEIF